MNSQPLDPDLAPSGPDQDDPRVLAALKEYQAALEAGSRPDRDEFLRRHPDIASGLAEALDAIEFVQAAANRLHPPAPLAPLTDSLVGTTLGEYRIVRELGRGGMGVVYEAVQLSLGRHVALKLLPPQGAASPRHLERFRREARAAARLHHTNIVPVFGVGEHRGLYYYAMQYIQGQSLDSVLRQLRSQQSAHGAAPTTAPSLPPATSQEGTDDKRAAGLVPAAGTGPVARQGPQPVGLDRPLSPEYFQAVARLGAQVADALDHAHQQGILHRDVKPSNLLLDVSGTLWVTDFGLAKVEGPEALTGSGDLVGTLRYLAPERFRGQADARGDVYSLGLTLYELATLRPAFPESDQARLIEQVTRADPPGPRRLEPAVPRDLETVILKAIDKEPAARYASAAELAEDLRRFLTDRPVLARRQSRVERTVRWCRRNPGVTLFLTLFIVALTAAAVLSFLFYVNKAADAQELADRGEKLRDEGEKLKKALRERDQADRRRHDALVLAAGVALDQGRALCERGEVGQGLLWLANGLTIAPPDAADLQRVLRGNLAAWHAEMHTLHARLEHRQPISAFAFSPDGSRVLTGSFDQTARLWDARTGLPIGPPRSHDHTVMATAFSPDSRLALTASMDRKVRLWDARTGAPVGAPLDHDQPVTRACFSPDGTLIAVCAYSSVCLWTVDGKGPPRKLQPGAEVMALAFSPDGKTLVTGHTDRNAYLWDVATGNRFGKPMTHGFWIRALACNDRLVLTGSADKTARFWDAQTGAPLGSPLYHLGPVDAVAFSPDGKYALTGSDDRKVRLWDTATRRLVGQPWEQGQAVTSVAFSPDGRLALSGSGDLLGKRGEARLWAVPSGQLLGLPLPHPGPVFQVAFSPDGRTAATASGRVLPNLGHVCLWEVPARWRAAEGEQPPPPRSKGIPLRHKLLIDALAFSPDSRLLLTGSYDKTARLWDTATGQAVGKPLSHPVEVTAVAFSADGRRFSTAGRDAVWLWEAPPGGARAGQGDAKLRAILPHEGDQVRALAFSPDGRLLATGTAQGALRLWAAETGKLVLTAVRQGRAALDLAFSSDSQTLLFTTFDHARLYDPATGQPLGPLLPAHLTMWAAALGPAGRRVVTVNADRTIHRWDGRTGKPLEPLPREPKPDGESRGLRTAAIGLDGRVVLLAGPDKTARLLDVDGKPLGPALHHAVAVRQVALAPDGRMALTAGDGLVQLWDARAGRAIGPGLGQMGRMAFSPDGKLFVTTAAEGTAWLFALPALEGEAERILLWAQVVTGEELTPQGVVQTLDAEELQRRRARLRGMAGPPLP